MEHEPEQLRRPLFIDVVRGEVPLGEGYEVSARYCTAAGVVVGIACIASALFVAQR